LDVQLADVIGNGFRLHRVCRDDGPPDGEPVPERISLGAAEVVYILPE
jgi:hypothetical protein